MSRGAMGIEFVVATAIFLAAFWFIYLQSAFMLTPQLQRGDVRELGVDFYSSFLVSDYEEGFAYYSSGSAKPNILNKTALDNVDGLNCSDIQADIMAGMEFAWRVTTSAKTWSCNTDVAEEGVIQRPVYVKFNAMNYKAGILEVWAG